MGLKAILGQLEEPINFKKVFVQKRNSSIEKQIAEHERRQRELEYALAHRARLFITVRRGVHHRTPHTTTRKGSERCRMRVESVASMFSAHVVQEMCPIKEVHQSTQRLAPNGFTRCTRNGFTRPSGNSHTGPRNLGVHIVHRCAAWQEARFFYH